MYKGFKQIKSLLLSVVAMRVILVMVDHKEKQMSHKVLSIYFMHDYPQVPLHSFRTSITILLKNGYFKSYSGTYVLNPELKLVLPYYRRIIKAYNKKDEDGKELGLDSLDFHKRMDEYKMYFHRKFK